MNFYLSCDSTALSLGAEDLAEHLQTQLTSDDQLKRVSTRGLLWAEPLLEQQTAAGRVGYGPLELDELEELLAAGLLNGAIEDHPKYLGLIEEMPYVAKQDPLIFSRLGKTDPTSLEDYLATDGFAGLAAALRMTPQAIVDEVKESGLRGRGGAAFPTGIKWQTVLDCDAPFNRQYDSKQKFIVCNADEGDSGTFADRILMEDDPYCLIEGMIIAGLAVGATQGYIYLRCEYPHAHKALNSAIARCYESGHLGANILASNKSFDLEVRLAAGAYICGEETSLLESLEGKRGQVRVKPPLPAIEGLFSQPTVVNNVISLASIPIIMAKGGLYYRDFGMGRSRGTMPFQLAGNIKFGGLVEVAFGMSLRELLYDFGGGTASGKPIKAVQIGGPLGAYIHPSQFDLPLDYEAFAADGGMLGHGGLVVFDESADMAGLARFAMEFCAEESCGKCTPCRIGSTRAQEVMDKIQAKDNVSRNLALLEDLCDTMESASLCALGGMAPYPVKSIIRHFPEEMGG